MPGQLSGKVAPTRNFSRSSRHNRTATAIACIRASDRSRPGVGREQVASASCRRQTPTIPLIRHLSSHRCTWPNVYIGATATRSRTAAWGAQPSAPPSAECPVPGSPGRSAYGLVGSTAAVRAKRPGYFGIRHSHRDPARDAGSGRKAGRPRGRLAPCGRRRANCCPLPAGDAR